VWLVGAGPGAPDLITVRGQRLLASADVVVHDRLVSEAVLGLIPQGTLRLDVGKTGYGSSMAQADIQALLIRLAREGMRVVRLKGGDPFVFGRGGEEVAALRAAGIPFEVVPGVTAGVAGPAAAGIPVTHRGLARSVAFVTATIDPEGAGRPLDWHALAAIDTLVVFMAGRSAPAVATSLRRAGRRADTPVAVILAAHLPDQEIRCTDLESLARAAPDTRERRPTLLVVGEVVGLAEPSAPASWAAGSAVTGP
jgi:uroporphyrin-III C-methyltransferase